MQTNNWNWLKLIAIGRILSALTFFMYVGSIQQLITVWELSATEAGFIQTSLVIGFAIALFISSYCSDFYNPNRILSIYLVINFLSSFVFYLIAKDFWTASFINFFIGFAIQSFAESNNCSVVRDFCGHGVGKTFHEEPNILHYGKKGEGLTIKKGMVFTIEPMINLGEYHTKVLSDGWTAVTKDKSLSAQFEHTVGIIDNGYEIFTL